MFFVLLVLGGVKQMIMKHRKLFRKSQPKPSFTGNKDNSFRDDRKVSELSFETGKNVFGILCVLFDTFHLSSSSTATLSPFGHKLVSTVHRMINSRMGL